MLKLFTKQDVKDMINKNMSLQEIQDEMGFTDIGQGYGYKSEEAWIIGENDYYKDKYITYIPEYCYNDETKQIEVESCYTRKDFIDITKDETQAKLLWEDVDWQHPSSLWNE